MAQRRSRSRLGLRKHQYAATVSPQTATGPFRPTSGLPTTRCADPLSEILHGKMQKMGSGDGCGVVLANSKIKAKPHVPAIFKSQQANFLKNPG
jgi:hypothetical protein